MRSGVQGGNGIEDLGGDRSSPSGQGGTWTGVRQARTQGQRAHSGSLAPPGVMGKEPSLPPKPSTRTGPKPGGPQASGTHRHITPSPTLIQALLSGAGPLKLSEPQEWVPPEEET